MEYLLVMSLSGSTMTGIHLLLWYLLKDKICARFYNLLARVAILYYLIPLPYLKKYYIAVFRDLWPESSLEISRVPLTWRNHIVHAEGAMHVNIFASIQTMITAVWLLGVCILMAGQVAEYVWLARKAAEYADRAMTPEQRAFLDGLKDQYGIRRRVFLYETTAEKRTMTFGFFSPVIVCSRHTTSREAEVKEYLRLMIEEAREKKTEKVSMRWKSGFGDDVRKIKERMENLMKRKKWNRVAAITLVAALALANSITVFAYRDVFERELPDDTTQEEIEMTIKNDAFLFVPEGMEGEGLQEFDSLQEMESVGEILYDKQFTDEEGNIYPIWQNDGVEPYCDHTFVSGIGADHTKTSDGGCVVREFYAQRCSKCGYVIQGKETNRVTYAKCPH